jgi:hypothetical protein
MSSRVEICILMFWHTMCVGWVVGSGILGLFGLVHTDTAAAQPCLIEGHAAVACTAVHDVCIWITSLLSLRVALLLLLLISRRLCLHSCAGTVSQGDLW